MVSPDLVGGVASIVIVAMNADEEFLGGAVGKQMGRQADAIVAIVLWLSSLVLEEGNSRPCSPTKNRIPTMMSSGGRPIIFRLAVTLGTLIQVCLRANEPNKPNLETPQRIAHAKKIKMTKSRTHIAYRICSIHLLRGERAGARSADRIFEAKNRGLYLKKVLGKGWFDCEIIGLI